MRAEVVRLNGGKKHLWLRQNRQLVLDYCRQFGKEATLERFNMRKYTLDNMLVAEASEQQYAGKDDIERVALKTEITDAGVKELKHEIKELKAEYSKFTESVSSQLVSKFFYPLLLSVINLPDDMKEPADSLALSDFPRLKRKNEAKEDG